MGSFLDLNVNDAQEYVSVPEGEQQLRILAAEIKSSKQGKGDFFNVKFQIMGENPFTKDINHVMMIPTDKDDVKVANNRKLAIKRFLEAFGIAVTGRLEPETWVGSTGWAFLVEESTEEYGTQNRVRRFIVGK